MRYYELKEISMRIDNHTFENIPNEIHSLDKHIEKWVLISYDSNIKIFQYKEFSDCDTFFSYTNDKIISLVSLIENDGLYSILSTWTDPAFRSKGIMSKLLLSTVDFYGVILSDNQHTNDAKYFCIIL